MMKRVISSAWTITYKAFIPIVLGAISVFLVVNLFIQSLPRTLDGYMVLLLTMAAALFFTFWGARLKWVALDDGNLYVSNWITEITIPASAIQSVEGLYGGWRVMIRLKTESRFGRKIFFLAHLQPFVFSPSRPVVEELRRMAASAGNNVDSVSSGEVNPQEDS